MFRDTTYIEHFIHGDYGFTVRHYWDNKFRKHDQIIRPEKSDVENIYVYNNKDDLIEVIHVEPGLPETSMIILYKYDILDRIIEKETYYGKELGSKEITVYD